MYQVPNLALIAQRNSMSCWFAAAQMLIQWKRGRARATLRRHPDPEEVRQTVAWEVGRRGLINPRVLEMARLLGLRAIPPLTPTLSLLEGYLRRYGPLWTNGKDHIVVIAGVDQSSERVLVYDPWPPQSGKVEWRDFSSWYFKAIPVVPGTPDSSGDIGRDVEAVFLYHP